MTMLTGLISGDRPRSIVLTVVLLAIPFVETGPEGTIEAPSWLLFVLIGALVVYDTVLISVWGRTVGKRLFGLRVACIEDGSTPDGWRSAIRVLLPAAIAVLPVIGVAVVAVFARAALDPIRQGFHDRAAATVVVRAG